jgi:hypothetical protein
VLKSGFIQIVAKILERLSWDGVRDRDHAWEYLANARDARKSPDEEAALAARLAEAPGGVAVDGRGRMRSRLRPYLPGRRMRWVIGTSACSVSRSIRP